MQGKDLDRTIRLERATVTQDPGSGENIETWVTLGPEKLFANYKPVSDGEKLSAGELAATLSARFTVSYDSSISDVNPKDRLVFEGRTFDIFGAKEAGERRRRFIEITASARAD
jgi:SPP1 family predicted phage head-tail adaptor